MEPLEQEGNLLMKDMGNGKRHGYRHLFEQHQLRSLSLRDPRKKHTNNPRSE